MSEVIRSPPHPSYNVPLTAGSPIASPRAAADTNLLGRWKLIRDGSDFLPGLDSLPDSPLVLKLLGNVEVEFYKIEKKKVMDCEEIQLTYVTKNISLTRAYQVGILNFENINNNDITLGIVQNCEDDFHEFTLVRLGPKTGQNSRETYKLDTKSDIIKLCIEVTTADGTRLNLVKYLARFDQPGERVPQNYPENSSHHHHQHPTISGNIPFIQSANTMGWKLFEFWPSNLLTNAKIKIVRAIKIKTQNAITKEGVKILEVLWENNSRNQTEVDYRNISRSLGGKSSEGEEVVEFIIQVTLGDSQWYIAHRYREFDALRKFLLGQNPFTAQFQQIDSKFPGKSVVMRRNVLERRVEGLEQYLAFYLDNARYCRQNSIDALCSFLQLPEHMHAVATKVAEAEAAQAAAIAAAHARAQALAPPQSATSNSNNSSPIKSGPASGTESPTPAPLVAQKSRVRDFFGLSGDDKGTNKTEKVAKSGDKAPSVSSTTSPSSSTTTETAVAPVNPPSGNAKATTSPSSTPSTNSSSSSNPSSEVSRVDPAAKPQPSIVAAQATTSPTTNQIKSQPAASSASTNIPPAVTAVQTNVTPAAPPTPPVINPNPIKLSPAQQRLYQYIGDNGIAIIKHGRQGAPKHRMLTCDDDVTELIVQASDSHYKKCVLSEVEAIRLGTDVDPATPQEVLDRFRAENNGTNPTPARTMNRRASSRMSILGGSVADNDGILYGTAILRRTCKKDDMSMCISLIMPNRTFDIQCIKVEDLQVLYSCLTEICAENRS